MEAELELMLEDFLENHKDIEIKKFYLKIYNNFDNKSLQKILAYFHQELNELFFLMNKKNNSNKHYNASYSRLLIQVIDELRYFIKATNNTKYKTNIEKEYINKIKESKKFLQSYGGSLIPDDFSDVNIIKYRPIFLFRNLILKSEKKDKIDLTEANFEDKTISIILKKEVFSHIKKLLNTGNYYNAVEEAYKLVREKLRKITGDEQAHKAFNEKNYKLLFGNNPKDDIEKDFFDGVKFLHMAIQKLRNEKAHKPAEDIEKNLAIHYIVLVSLAYDLIDR